MKLSRFLMINAAITLALVSYIGWCWSGFVLGAEESWPDGIPPDARTMIEERLTEEGAIAFTPEIAFRALANPYHKPRLFVFVDGMDPDWVEVTKVVQAGTKDTNGSGYGLFCIDGEWMWSDPAPPEAAPPALAAAGS